MKPWNKLQKNFTVQWLCLFLVVFQHSWKQNDAYMMQAQWEDQRSHWEWQRFSSNWSTGRCSAVPVLGWTAEVISSSYLCVRRIFLDSAEPVDGLFWQNVECRIQSVFLEEEDRVSCAKLFHRQLCYCPGIQYVIELGQFELLSVLTTRSFLLKLQNYKAGCRIRSESSSCLSGECVCWVLFVWRMHIHSVYF